VDDPLSEAELGGLPLPEELWDPEIGQVARQCHHRQAGGSLDAFIPSPFRQSQMTCPCASVEGT